jgi:Rad3-related DNA helicase
MSGNFLAITGAFSYCLVLDNLAIEYPTLLQGTGPRNALLDEFRSTPNCVLFATASFWQGVDVPGEQLSCVIIDKLPFAVPSDPVVEARIAAIREDGGERQPNVTGSNDANFQGTIAHAQLLVLSEC